MSEIAFNHRYSFAWNASEFFKLNAQLQSFQSPIYSDSMFMASISELPNLENLFLWLLPPRYYLWNNNYPTSRFKHVKHFSLNMLFRETEIIESDAYRRILATIQFDCLESFSLISNNRNPIDFLIGMIVKDTALQKITMRADLTFDQLRKLMASFTKLKDLTITWQKQATHSTYKQFLEHAITSNNSLDKFSIEIFRYLKIDTSDLLDLVPFGWKKSETMDNNRDSVLFIDLGLNKNGQLICWHNQKCQIKQWKSRAFLLKFVLG